MVNFAKQKLYIDYYFTTTLVVCDDLFRKVFTEYVYGSLIEFLLFKKPNISISYCIPM
jgi:hypothetical protein